MIEQDAEPCRIVVQPRFGPGLDDQENVNSAHSSTDDRLNSDSDDDGGVVDKVRDLTPEDAVSPGHTKPSASILRGTPSYNSRRTRGIRKPRTPSPSPSGHALPHEHYFFQTRPGNLRASDSLLQPDVLMGHEKHYVALNSWRDPHENELEFLFNLHSRLYDQWMFELDQEFNLCLYGWGSKRAVLTEFGHHVKRKRQDSHVVVIDGCSQSLRLQDILHTLVACIPTINLTGRNTCTLPTDMLAGILHALAREPSHTPILLLINSIDGTVARRPFVQHALEQLASGGYIRIVATADTPNFPLIWDASTLTMYNWLFHDCTTYRPYDFEIESASASSIFGEFQTILSRSGRRIFGRDGVIFVLKCLTQSARDLFGLLAAELLALGNHESITTDTPKALFVQGNNDGMQVKGLAQHEVEWRDLYHKAVEQFIATSELSFRGLLKEFHDHEMVVSRKDAFGTELLSIPFRTEELELLLEELTAAS